MTDGVTEQQEGTTTWAVEEPAEPEADAGPRVLLLGSDESGQELAVALQRLGAEVITADADTLSDAEELTAVVAALQPDFVVTLPGAFDTSAAVTVLEELEAQDTELVPGARAVRLTADREGLRKLAADELGLPTAPFWFVDSLAELEAVAAHAGFPLLVKAVDGSGRSVVRGADEVARAWELAGAGGRVWAETVVDVEFLVTLIVVRTEGPSGPVIEFCAPIGHGSDDNGALESWQPQHLTTAAVDAAKSIAARIVKSLGGRGVFSVELMINGDEVYFAEVIAGPSDSAWVTLRSQRLSIFELQARAVLGVAVDTMMVSPGAARLVDHGPAAPGVAPSGDVLASALAVPESDLRVFGSTTDEQPASVPDKWGVTLATAPEVTAARDRAREVATRLNVRDSRG
ncbi:phosphoribosylglycinamide formyltransferase [Mycobacterium gordonae]|uniref:Phosphoribosylglycinamide formyltransferase n=1 Tax=Mycobacterium gordonae TaxID=1778 RepID=A0A0Q2X5U3_MYCGO|nr:MULTISPECIES: formate-dependent phosphoribosylglycinamide formyltransferase [Mycobacterium]KQH76676.1 phosphoribosylglycinamide formyltransferase [Mycobacterium gordonae]MDP7730546.1 formate-dependent phosphoribosylglycinamide formyltransferase [Mycobacterium sp. TY813]